MDYTHTELNIFKEQLLNLFYMRWWFVSVQTSDPSQQADRVRTLRELHEPELPSDQRYPVGLQKHW